MRCISEFWRGAPKIREKEVTCVSELLYRNIVSQSGTRLENNRSKPMN